MGSRARVTPLRGIAAVAAIAVIALLACANRSSAADTIKIGVVRSMGGGPTFVAKENGYFAAEGLDAEVVLFESAQPIALAVASGDCVFGATAMTAAFFNLAGQGALKIIGAGTWEHPGFQSIGVLVSNQAYAGGLHSFKDLGGHSVAITQLGTPLQYFLLRIADKYRIDAESIRFLPLQSNGNVASALAGGQTDAAVQTAAPAYAIIEKGDARLLGWTSDELPRRQGEAVFTATRTADGRPDTVKHFLRALRAGERYFHDAFVDANDQRREGPTAHAVIAIAAKYLEQPETVIKRGIPFFDPESRVSVKDIAAPMAWYKAQHMLKGEIEAEALVDARYAIAMPER